MFSLGRKLAGYLINFRFHSKYQISRNYSQHLAKEVSIKMPWGGHVAALHWNPSSSAIPVLCMHGWKDNAGTFNKIIPALLDHSNKYQFLSIDLPGHGFSSHYPPGMLYQVIDTMIVIRRVLRHFNWEKRVGGVYILGHSLGAILGFIFTASHPKIATCLIAIDALVPVMFSKGDLTHMINTATKGYLYVEAKYGSESNNTETYEKHELVQRLQMSHLMGIDTTACEILSVRGIIESPPGSNKFKFSHDPRVQFFPLMGFSQDQIEYLAKLYQSNLLHLKAEHGVTYISDKMESRVKKWIVKDNDHTVKFSKINGTHHCHIATPDLVVKEIMLFLNAVR